MIERSPLTSALTTTKSEYCLSDARHTPHIFNYPRKSSITDALQARIRRACLFQILQRLHFGNRTYS